MAAITRRISPPSLMTDLILSPLKMTEGVSCQEVHSIGHWNLRAQHQTLQTRVRRAAWRERNLPDLPVELTPSTQDQLRRRDRSLPFPALILTSKTQTFQHDDSPFRFPVTRASSLCPVCLLLPQYFLRLLLSLNRRLTKMLTPFLET